MEKKSGSRRVTFAYALRKMRDGYAVRREGWTNDNWRMTILPGQPIDGTAVGTKPRFVVWGDSPHSTFDKERITAAAFLARYGELDAFGLSPEDLLANDWLVEEKVL